MDAHAKIIHGNVIVEDKLIENERLELTNKEHHYFLGPGLTMRNCTLVLKVSARVLFLRQARFIDCTFDVKQELKNHQQWVFASLKGCRFKGKFSGCDFGTWPEYVDDRPPGSIEDCDFSEARLDGCRFMGCDERTLRFPPWPCFTLLDPIGNASRLRDAPWPAWFGDVVIRNLHTEPSATRAITLHAPSIAKRMQTTPDALKAVIDTLDCVVR